MKQNPKLNDYFHSFNSDNIQYFNSIQKYIKQTKNIKGNIVECGIGRGRSLICLCYLKKELNLKKEIYAFDSFGGFKFISKKDNSYRKPKKGDWERSPNQKIKYTKNFIHQVLKFHLFKKNYVKYQLIKGYVENTIPKFKKKIGKISFLSCDVDLFSGHKVILENLWANLSKGGIIYFDDVYPKKIKKLSFPGARLAYDEFFKDKKNLIEEVIDKERGNLVIKKI